MRIVIAALVVLAPWTQSTGRIAGTVSTSEEPGRRLARAYVSLIGTHSSERRLTMTRDDGTFEFTDVPAGPYVVEAGKLPHLAGSQRVVISRGQSKAELTFRLKRSGTISGLVFDDRGQPVRDAIVSAMRIHYERGGAMTVSAGQSATTDRSGRFRIHSLAPGGYVVTTTAALFQFTSSAPLSDSDVDRALQGVIAPRPSRPPLPLPPPFDPRVQSVFVPGVSRADAATIFVISDGTEHTGVAAHLVAALPGGPVPLSTLSGVILGPDGQPMEADVRVSYEPGPVRLAVAIRQVRAPQGHFILTGLVPGPARLIASVAGKPLQGSLDVNVSGERMTDLTLRLQPPVETLGRVADAGVIPVRAITVKTLGGIFIETRSVDVKESGEFRLSLFPGKYLIESGSIVTIDGRDMTDRAIDIQHGAPIKNLTVSFSEDVQDITGRVTNTDGAGVNTVTMVAFSTVESDWFHQSRRIAVAEPAADGRYQLGGAGPQSMPAGDYYLAAVTDLSPGEQYNPAFLRTLVDAAIKVTVSSGQRAVQDVRVR